MSHYYTVKRKCWLFHELLGTVMLTVTPAGEKLLPLFSAEEKNLEWGSLFSISWKMSSAGVKAASAAVYNLPPSLRGFCCSLKLSLD